MSAISRLSEIAFFPTLGAFAAKPIRTTRSCAPRKASADFWRAMPLRNSGPTLRGTFFTSMTNIGSSGGGQTRTERAVWLLHRDYERRVKPLADQQPESFLSEVREFAKRSRPYGSYLEVFSRAWVWTSY